MQAELGEAMATVAWRDGDEARRRWDSREAAMGIEREELSLLPVSKTALERRARGAGMGALVETGGGAQGRWGSQRGEEGAGPGRKRLRGRVWRIRLRAW